MYTNKYVFVDAWAWLELSNRKDIYHELARKEYAKMKASGYRMVTSDYVLDEVITAQFKTAWSLRKKYQDKPDISFTDLTSFALMQELAINSVFTGDVSFNATIKVNYSSALPFLTIPEANLRLYRFNDLNDAWEPTIQCGDVDTVNKIVCGITTGFSTFAVMGAAPSQPSSGGSGDSTGGGGVTTPEPAKNIVKHETKDCNVLSLKPSSCKFRVENSWIASEGLTSENLRMYRWDGAKWSELETRVLSKDASATKVAETTAAPTTTAPAVTPSATATAPPATQEPIQFVYIIILIGVIAVIVYLYAATQKKK